MWNDYNSFDGYVRVIKMYLPYYMIQIESLFLFHGFSVIVPVVLLDDIIEYILQSIYLNWYKKYCI